jgi:hypothetical protein
MNNATRISAMLALTSLALTQAFAEQVRDQRGSILGQLPTSSERIVSTVPSNGDENPYGVAFVPKAFGPAARWSQAIFWFPISTTTRTRRGPERQL